MAYTQNATYNPIKRKEDIHSFSSAKTIPRAEAGTVIVLSKELLSFENSLLNVNKGSVTKSDIFFGRYKAAYFIDVSVHNVEFRYELDTSNPVYKVLANVSLSCSVKKPFAIIEKNINDACSYIAKFFISEMAVISENFDVTQWLSIQKKINRERDAIAAGISEFKIDKIICKIEPDEVSKKRLEEIEKIKFEQQKNRIQIEEFIKATGNTEANILLLDYLNDTKKGKDLIDTEINVKKEKWDHEVEQYNDVLNILGNAVKSDTVDSGTVNVLTNMFIKNMINRIEASGENPQSNDSKNRIEQAGPGVSEKLIAEDIRKSLSHYEEKPLLPQSNQEEEDPKGK